MRYQVIVGNIGITTDTDQLKEALEYYGEYKRQSISGVGRAGNEQVTLMDHDEPLYEYVPPYEPMLESLKEWAETEHPKYYESSKTATNQRESLLNLWNDHGQPVIEN